MVPVSIPMQAFLGPCVPRSLRVRYNEDYVTIEPEHLSSEEYRNRNKYDVLGWQALIRPVLVTFPKDHALGHESLTSNRGKLATFCVKVFKYISVLIMLQIM